MLEQELRRDHLAEGNERADCGAGGAEEQVAISRAASHTEPDRDHRGDLEQCREDPRRARRAAPRDSAARGSTPSSVEAEELVSGEQDPQAEALDLEWSAGLHPRTRPRRRPATVVQGNDDCRDHGRERAAADERLARRGVFQAWATRSGAGRAGRPSRRSLGRACRGAEADTAGRGRRPAQPTSNPAPARSQAPEDDQAEQQRRDGDESGAHQEVVRANDQQDDADAGGHSSRPSNVAPCFPRPTATARRESAASRCSTAKSRYGT